MSRTSNLITLGTRASGRQTESCESRGAQMHRPPCSETSSAGTAKVLSVSPSKADHDLLCRILQQRSADVEPHSGWMVYPVASVTAAFEALAEQAIPIVISEAHLSAGTWQTLLDALSLLPEPPLLIVASRVADERLWSEALNLGAWDVLAKPFDAQEVVRVMETAWRHWNDRRKLRPIRRQPLSRV
jgi:DNA-binding NtrC family response regulator